MIGLMLRKTRECFCRVQVAFFFQVETAKAAVQQIGRIHLTAFVQKQADRFLSIQITKAEADHAEGIRYQLLVSAAH